MRRWLDQRLARNQGFTIVEVLIVIAVIGVLATIVVVGYGAVVNNTRDTALKSDLEKIADTIKLEALDNDSIPAGGATSSLTGDSTILSGVYVTPSADLYDVTVNNLFYCAGTLAGNDEFAVIAKSVTGKVFGYVSNEGITELNPIPAPWDYEGICTSVGFAAPYTWSYGYNPNSSSGWYAWAEAEGTIATGCAEGYIIVPGNATFGTDDFCVMKYEAKNVGGVATSEAEGLPWGNITQTSAISTAAAACSGCHLMTEQEWMTIAHDVVTVGDNWTGGSVGSGNLYRGMNDSSPATTQEADTNDANGYYATGDNSSSGQDQRRTLTLSNGEVIWDLVGNIWEWTSGTITGNQPGGVTSMYREWNTIGSMGDLPAYTKPEYGNPALSGYTTVQGIGAIYSSTAIGTLVGFYRGGGVNQYQPTNNGVFNLALDRAPSAPTTLHGFRVTK